MRPVENRMFRFFIAVSAFVHAGAMAAFASMSPPKTPTYVQAASTEPINVMWARPVGNPDPTPKDKLPGPAVMPQPSVKAPPEKPIIVMPDSKPRKEARTQPRPKTPSREEREEEARRRAMAEAVAGIRRDIEARPAPRLENFPHVPGGSVGGYGGAVSGLRGTPLCGHYAEEIRSVVTGNFVWLQSRGLKSTFTFRVGAEGEVLEPQLTASSGNASYDAAAMRALRRSRLPTPPQPCSGQYVEMDFER